MINLLKEELDENAKLSSI